MFIDSLYDTARRHPNRLALIADNRMWTYRRLADDVERTSRAMWASGLRPGDRVALHMPNRPELAIACLAGFRLGAIVVPVNNRFKTNEIEALFERVRPALYIGHDSFQSSVLPIAESVLPTDARVIVGSSTWSGRGCHWQSLFEDDATVADIAMPSPDAPALLLTTSSTTGQPKLVAHSLTSLTETAKRHAHLGIAMGDRLINFSPLVHASGICVSLSAYFTASSMIVLEKFDPDAALDAIEGYEGAWVGGQPFMFAELLARQRERPRDLSSLRFCISAGDICPAALQQEFPFTMGRPLHQTWGMTEFMSGPTFGKRSGRVIDIPGDMEIRLVDERGAAVVPGEIGELLVRCPSLALGYWTAPGRVEPLVQNGWFATGDVMKSVGSDELSFVGRRKFLIVRNGSNVDPAEVEQALKRHPAIRDAAVFGMPDPITGERVVAVFELSKGKLHSVIAEVISLASEHLADYKLPEQMGVVDRIPRNALGEIERKDLPNLLANLS